MIHDIRTPRLTLRHIPVAILQACLAGETATAEAILGLAIPPEWFDESDLMALRLNDCRTDPEYAPWSLRAIGLAKSGVMVGHIGFHTRPDQPYLRSFVPDGIEFGYTIFPEFRRQGFAEEAARGLIGWAVTEHGLRHFVVSISPTNCASQRLAMRLGFVKVGTHQDEVDGEEDVLVLAGEALARVCFGGGKQ